MTQPRRSSGRHFLAQAQSGESLRTAFGWYGRRNVLGGNDLAKGAGRWRSALPTGILNESTIGVVLPNDLQISGEGPAKSLAQTPQACGPQPLHLLVRWP